MYIRFLWYTFIQRKSITWKIFYLILLQANTSYQFGFDVKDDYFTNYQNRKEQKENGKITGSYSVVDSDGYIRTVTYTADPKEGFKAEVKSSLHCLKLLCWTLILGFKATYRYCSKNPETYPCTTKGTTVH